MFLVRVAKLDLKNIFMLSPVSYITQKNYAHPVNVQCKAQFTIAHTIYCIQLQGINVPSQTYSVT